MPNFNDACLKILNENQQFTTVAVIEVGSALVLGLASDSDLSLDYYETLAASVVNIYTGRNTKTVEMMMARMRDEIATSSLHEIQLIMDAGNVFVSPLIDTDKFLMLVVAPVSHDLEYLWEKVHNNLCEISEIINES